MTAMNQLFDAMIYLGAPTVGSMIVSADIPLEILLGGSVFFGLSIEPVTFVFDKNDPKVQILSLERLPFYLQFSTKWQAYKFSKKFKTLKISGIHQVSNQEYVLTLYLDGVKLRRGT